MHFQITLLASIKSLFRLKKVPEIIPAKITRSSHNRTQTGYYLLNTSDQTILGVKPGNLYGPIKPGQFARFCRNEGVKYNSVMANRSSYPNKNVRCIGTGWVLLAKNDTNRL